MEKKVFNCNICDKLYKSYKTLWKHNKDFHTSKNLNLSSNTSKSTNFPQKSTRENLLECKFCNKKLSRLDNLKRHEKICKVKIEKINENNNMSQNEKELFEKFKKQFIEDKKVRNELLKSLKINPQQIQKINNQLNLNQQNNINNNINYFQLGYEDFNEKLSEQKKLGILNRQANSINRFIEMIYQEDKYKPYQNVYLTNLRSNFAYKYDENKNKFITVKQKDVLDHLFESRLYDIQQFYEDLENKMDPYKADQMKIFLSRIENELDFRNNKKEEVKLVLYNNKESVKKVFDEINKEIEI